MKSLQNIKTSNFENEHLKPLQTKTDLSQHQGGKKWVKETQLFI